MDQKQLERSIERLFCFWPSDSEEIVEVINDMIDFIKEIVGHEVNEDKLIIEIKENIAKILED